jgi:predicted aminopeptidase
MPFLTGSSSGCVGTNFGYILTAGSGQFNVLTHTVPLDEVLADPKLDADRQEKLLWVQQSRDYAKESLGLKTRKNFTTFYDTGDGPAVYNLSASRKDALEPLTWSFPIIGQIQYLGYFKADQAEKKALDLQEQGYDVIIYGAIAYSTLGYFKDPIFSSVLDLDKGQLAELIIHELTHATVYKAGDSEFNESVANFVGRTGALQFIAEIEGSESELLTRYTNYKEDNGVINSFLDEFIDELQAFYARTDLTSEEKIARREEIFQSARQRFAGEIAPTLHEPDRFASVADMPTSNAWILLHYRYNKDMTIFEDVYQTCGRDLAKAVKVFKLAEDADDSYQFLRDWLTNHQ